MNALLNTNSLNLSYFLLPVILFFRVPPYGGYPILYLGLADIVVHYSVGYTCWVTLELASVDVIVLCCKMSDVTTLMWHQRTNLFWLHFILLMGKTASLFFQEMALTFHKIFMKHGRCAFCANRLWAKNIPLLLKFECGFLEDDLTQSGYSSSDLANPGISAIYNAPKYTISIYFCPSKDIVCFPPMHFCLCHCNKNKLSVNTLQNYDK